MITLTLTILSAVTELSSIINCCQPFAFLNPPLHNSSLYFLLRILFTWLSIPNTKMTVIIQRRLVLVTFDFFTAVSPLGHCNRFIFNKGHFKVKLIHGHSFLNTFTRTLFTVQGGKASSTKRWMSTNSY